MSRGSQCAWKRKWCAGRNVRSSSSSGGNLRGCCCSLVPDNKHVVSGGIDSLAAYGYQCPRSQFPDEEYPDPTAKVPKPYTMLLYAGSRHAVHHTDLLLVAWQAFEPLRQLGCGACILFVFLP